MSPGERFCGPCRKRRKGKMKIGVLGEPVSLTAEMERHLSHVEVFGILPYKDPVEALTEDALEFLDDPNKKFDDSFIYDELAREERLARLMEEREDRGAPRGRRGFRHVAPRKGSPEAKAKAAARAAKVEVKKMEAVVKVKVKKRKSEDWFVF